MLMTIQLNYLVSCSQDDPNWIPRINMNGAYTYYPTYDETFVAYNRPTVMPVLFLEEHYEDENWQANRGRQGFCGCRSIGRSQPELWPGTWPATIGRIDSLMAGNRTWIRNARKNLGISKHS